MNKNLHWQKQSCLIAAAYQVPTLSFYGLKETTSVAFRFPDNPGYKCDRSLLFSRRSIETGYWNGLDLAFAAHPSCHQKAHQTGIIAKYLLGLPDALEISAYVLNWKKAFSLSAHEQLEAQLRFQEELSRHLREHGLQ